MLKRLSMARMKIFYSIQIIRFEILTLLKLIIYPKCGSLNKPFSFILDRSKDDGCSIMIREQLSFFASSLLFYYRRYSFELF